MRGWFGCVFSLEKEIVDIASISAGSENEMEPLEEQGERGKRRTVKSVSLKCLEKRHGVMTMEAAR